MEKVSPPIGDGAEEHANFESFQIIELRKIVAFGTMDCRKKVMFLHVVCTSFGDLCTNQHLPREKYACW